MAQVYTGADGTIRRREDFTDEDVIDELGTEDPRAVVAVLKRRKFKKDEQDRFGERKERRPGGRRKPGRATPPRDIVPCFVVLIYATFTLFGGS